MQKAIAALPIAYQTVAASRFTAGGGEANKAQDRMGLQQQLREQCEQTHVLDD
jgi:hypothetical protein